MAWTQSGCPLKVQDYWTCKTELSLVYDIVFKRNKFVIPLSVWKDMPIHKGHMGEEKCKCRPSGSYVLAMNEPSATPQPHVNYAWLTNQNSKQSYSWHTQHQIDHYTEWEQLYSVGKSHIVLPDYQNHPEVGTLQSTSSKAVIAFLKTVFGVWCELISDNGTQFASSEFTDLLPKNGGWST